MRLLPLKYSTVKEDNTNQLQEGPRFGYGRPVRRSFSWVSCDYLIFLCKGPSTDAMVNPIFSEIEIQYPKSYRLAIIVTGTVSLV